MQSTATFLERQPRPSRDALLSWLRAAAWVVLAGAVSPSALAQAAADSAATESTEAASEPPAAAAPDTTSQSQPDVPGPWNKRRTAPTRVDAQVRRLAADLKLDAAQQAKVRTILVARSEEMQRLQHDTQLTPAQRQQRAVAIGDRSAEQIRAQLTDAQRAQYIQPRAATTGAQAAPGARRGRMVAPPANAPVKGAAS